MFLHNLNIDFYILQINIVLMQYKIILILILRKEFLFWSKIYLHLNMFSLIWNFFLSFVQKQKILCQKIVFNFYKR